MARHFVDATGKYVAAFDGCTQSRFQKDGDEIVKVEQSFFPDVPAGAIEVAVPPADARQTWDGHAWSDPALLPPLK